MEVSGGPAGFTIGTVSGNRTLSAAEVNAWLGIDPLVLWLRSPVESDLGNSGIKFEIEGGEGSPGADTYIPLHQKIAILQHFSETFRKMLYFGEIPKKFGQN